jgi:hypothetical protein
MRLQPGRGTRMTVFSPADEETREKLERLTAMAS